jgi:hypothetical protein
MALSKRDKELIRASMRPYSGVKEGIDEINAKLGKMLQTLYGPNLDRDFVAENTAAIQAIQVEHKVVKKTTWGAVATAGAALIAAILKWISHT